MGWIWGSQGSDPCHPSPKKSIHPAKDLLLSCDASKLKMGPDCKVCVCVCVCVWCVRERETEREREREMPGSAPVVQSLSENPEGRRRIQSRELWWLVRANTGPSENSNCKQRHTFTRSSLDFDSLK